MKWQITLSRRDLDTAVKEFLVKNGKVAAWDQVQCLNAPAIGVTIIDGEAPKDVGPDLADAPVE